MGGFEQWSEDLSALCLGIFEKMTFVCDDDTEASFGEFRSRACGEIIRSNVDKSVVRLIAVNDDIDVTGVQIGVPSKDFFAPLNPDRRRGNDKNGPF